VRPWLAAAAALLALALYAAVARAAPGGRVAYVATDPADSLFLEDGLRHGLPPGPVLGLGGVLRAPRLPRLVAALDPNWGPGEELEALNAFERLVNHVLGGGVLVAGLNGAVAANLTLARLGSPLPPVGRAACAPAPPGYDFRRYGCLPRPPGARTVALSDGMVAYVLRLGDGWLVVLPYNLVWAYLDTRSPVYLEAAREALLLAEKLPSANPLPGEVAAAAAIAAAVAVSVSSSSSQRRRGRGARGAPAAPAAASPMWARVGRDEALSHPVRRRIYSLVAERGALGFNELWRELGVAKATVAWHLSVLERLGLLSTVRYRRYLLAYLPGPRGAAALFSALSSRDPAFCLLVGEALRGAGLEEAARRLRVRPRALEGIYRLVAAYPEEAAEACRVGE